MATSNCSNCLRLRGHLEAARGVIGALELKLEGERAKVRKLMEEKTNARKTKSCPACGRRNDKGNRPKRDTDESQLVLFGE